MTDPVKLGFESRLDCREATVDFLPRLDRLHCTGMLLSGHLFRPVGTKLFTRPHSVGCPSGYPVTGSRQKYTKKIIRPGLFGKGTYTLGGGLRTLLPACSVSRLFCEKHAYILQVTMSRTFSSAIDMQGRVLWALCLREIHGKHGRFRIGYLWQLIKTGFSVGVFWWIREMGHFHPPQGLSMPIFLLMGFVPWFIFADTLNMTMEAVRTNRALLTFPQITPLDLHLSSAIVAAGTEIVVLALFMAGVALAGYTHTIHNFFIFQFSLVGVALLGFGSGLVFATLNHYLPVIEKLVPMVLRVMFFMSGVFFSPSQMAAVYGDAIMWIPVANFIELLRGVFISPYPPHSVKVAYVISLTVVLLVLGLLLERHVRPLQEAA